MIELSVPNVDYGFSGVASNKKKRRLDTIDVPGNHDGYCGIVVLGNIVISESQHDDEPEE